MWRLWMFITLAALVVDYHKNCQSRSRLIIHNLFLTLGFFHGYMVPFSHHAASSFPQGNERLLQQRTNTWQGWRTRCWPTPQTLWRWGDSTIRHKAWTHKRYYTHNCASTYTLIFINYCNTRTWHIYRGGWCTFEYIQYISQKVMYILFHNVSITL